MFLDSKKKEIYTHHPNPQLEQKISLLKRQHEDLDAKIGGLMERMMEFPSDQVRELFAGKLEGLVEQKEQLAGEISRVEDALVEAEIQMLNASDISESLEHFSTVFDRLESHEKREMVVDEVVFTGAEMKISLLGFPKGLFYKGWFWVPCGIRKAPHRGRTSQLFS